MSRLEAVYVGLRCADFLVMRHLELWTCDREDVFYGLQMAQLDKSDMLATKGVTGLFVERSITLLQWFKTMTNQQPSIKSRLDHALAERVAVNQYKLGSIMKALLLCPRHNFA